LHNIGDARTNRPLLSFVKQLRHDHTRWEVADDFAPLLGPVLAAAPHIVKESRAKLVGRHEVDGRAFYVKRYRHDAFAFRPLKFVFKASQARQEWRLAEGLAARGIPIVRHVALGERWSATGLQESILITEEFAGVPANEAPAEVYGALMGFIGQMVDAGVVQRDLHPANLLVRQHPFEIRLVDLHGTFLVRRNSQFEREGNRDDMLARLRVSVPIPVSQNVEWFSRELRRRALRQRSRRCLKVNREFALKRFGRWKWHVRTAAVTADMEKLLCNPDAFIEGAHPLKEGRSSTVAAANGLVLKRYNFKKPFNLLKDLVRGSRGRRGFRKAYHLELCGIATPRVIATTDRRVCGLPARSYVLMEEVPHAIDAGQWQGDERRAARALGDLLGRLHDEGFTHRDLKETNVLFDAAGTPQLIDLDGLEFVFYVAEDEAWANLRRVAQGLAAAGKVNRPNTIAFLLTYCRRRRMRPAELFPPATALR
jgi:tRNA A-37 threonylcarbamoyl transferase component Bud32